MQSHEKIKSCYLNTKSLELFYESCRFYGNIVGGSILKEIKHQQISDRKPLDDALGNWKTAEEFVTLDDRKTVANKGQFNEERLEEETKSDNFWFRKQETHPQPQETGNIGKRK